MRIYQVVLLAATGIVIAAIAAFILYGGGTGGKGVASIGGPFSLIDDEGQTKTDKDFRGRYVLIYFGYTYCPDVCPTALQSMTQAMDRLAPESQAKITPIFITIDPERDTAKQLKAYVENFHPRLVGLTGTPEQIAQTARLYRVYFGRAKDEREESTEYLMDHSSIIFLMNPEGEYVTHFTHATTPEKMSERLATVVGG